MPVQQQHLSSPKINDVYQSCDRTPYCASKFGFWEPSEMSSIERGLIENSYADLMTNTLNINLYTSLPARAKKPRATKAPTTATTK